MLLSYEMGVEGAFIVELVGAEFLDAKRQASRKPTGVRGTCANRYGGCTVTWENLLSPTEAMGGLSHTRKVQVDRGRLPPAKAKRNRQSEMPSEGDEVRQEG